MVFAGEVEVSLVVGRDAHDRARAVGGNDEVAEPDGHAPACQGMQCVGTGENAFLLERVGLALNAVHVAHVIDEGRDGGLVRASLDEPGREWMFGGHNNEGSAEQGIRAGCKDIDVIGSVHGLFKIEAYLCAFGAADPVVLHG